jgi:hypothetical protein
VAPGTPPHRRHGQARPRQSFPQEALAKLFDAVVTIWVELQVSGVFCDFRAVYPLRRLVRMFFEIDLSTARQPRDFLAGVSGSSGDDRKRRYVTKRRI